MRKNHPEAQEALRQQTLSPTEAVKAIIEDSHSKGFTPVGISFGQRDWIVFMRDYNRKRIKIVGEPDIVSISEFCGLKIYFKTAPGTELLYEAVDDDGKGGQ